MGIILDYEEKLTFLVVLVENMKNNYESLYSSLDAQLKIQILNGL